MRFQAPKRGGQEAGARLTLGTSSRPSVTVTVRCVWVKNSSSSQSGWSSWARANLSGGNGVGQFSRHRDLCRKRPG